MDHVEPIEKPNSRARKRSEDIWESLKVVICTEYRNRTLEELIQFLKVEHDFVPTKRQLVYRLGIWKCSKYGGYDLDENEEKENYSEELREIESNKLNNTIQGGFEQKNDHHTDHLDFETPQSASGWLAPMTDSSRDASYYRDFTQLLVQHIYESVVSGSVFVDLADHINRGHRLFEWATETDKAICAIRINHSYGSLMPLPFRKQLEALDELIMDEHPHLLGTLFVIWKNTSLIDDDNTSGRYFINIVNKLCQRLLGSQHLIGKIFACLSTGYFDPAACLERLEVLPSELFAPKDQALEPSFDKYGTSDYQTMSSLYAASEGSLAGAQGLELMSSEAVSSRALTLRQYSKERYRESSRPAPPTYPWETSPSITQALVDPEESFTTNLTDPRSPTNFAIRPVGINSHPFDVDRGRQSSMGSLRVFRTDDTWPMGKPEGSSASLSEQTGRPQENRPGKTREVLDASTSSLPRTPSILTPANGDMRMDMDEGLVSHDEESDIWSSSTADEQQCVRAWEAERRQIVQRIMESFLHDLDSHLEDTTGNSLSFKKENTSEPTQTPSQAEGSTELEQSKKPPKRQKTSGKGKDGGRWNRKYPAGDKHEGNESDEGEGGDERPRKVPDRHGGPTNMQFACPFYKWNPLEYQRKKDCAGPGWPTMHRLKEHLYRRHRRLPFQCSRCQKDLVSGTGLDSHLRVAQLCEIKDLIGEFKFGPDIERRLRVRSSPNRTEAERWKQAYIILFDAREDGVPTPYYDYDTSVLDREETWMEYQRREIAIRFRQRVEAEVERRFANVEPELMAGLRDIIQDVGLTMRQAFGRRQEEARNLDREESPAMPPPPPPPPPADLDESSTNTAQTPGNDEEQIAVVLRSPVNRDTGNFLLDDPQQEILFAWPEASGTVTQNQEIEEGDWAWDLSLDANFDTDFLDDVGGNVTL